MTGADPAGADFQMVVARWLLTQGELRTLLPGALRRNEVVPGDPATDTARRMSLVVALEAGLSGMLGRARASDWLRRPAAAFGGRSPLDAMAEEAVLVALVRAVGGGPATFRTAPRVRTPRGRRASQAPSSS